MSHLFFADDVIFFSKATVGSVQHIEVLISFSKASGLKANMGKSDIIFSKSVQVSIKQASNFKEGTLSVKCMGVPLHLKRLHPSQFRAVLDKVRKKLRFYGRNLLSLAGRAEMIRVVIIPQMFHWFQVIKFPVEIVKQLEQSIRNYLWKGQMDKSATIQVS